MEIFQNFSSELKDKIIDKILNLLLLSKIGSTAFSLTESTSNPNVAMVKKVK
jgi:hypothetical protein